MFINLCFNCPHFWIPSWFLFRFHLLEWFLFSTALVYINTLQVFRFRCGKQTDRQTGVDRRSPRWLDRIFVSKPFSPTVSRVEWKHLRNSRSCTRSPPDRMFSWAPFQAFFSFFFFFFLALFFGPDPVISPPSRQLTSCHRDLTHFPQESKQFPLYLHRPAFRCWNATPTYTPPPHPQLNTEKLLEFALKHQSVQACALFTTIGRPCS